MVRLKPRIWILECVFNYLALAARGFDSILIAQALECVVQKEAKDRLSFLILEGELDPGSRVRFKVDGLGFCFGALGRQVFGFFKGSA